MPNIRRQTNAAGTLGYKGTPGKMHNSALYSKNVKTDLQQHKYTHVLHTPLRKHNAPWAASYWLQRHWLAGRVNPQVPPPKMPCLCKHRQEWKSLFNLHAFQAKWGHRSKSPKRGHACGISILLYYWLTFSICDEIPYEPLWLGLARLGPCSSQDFLIPSSLPCTCFRRSSALCFLCSASHLGFWIVCRVTTVCYTNWKQA